MTLTSLLPAVVGVLYAITGGVYAWQGNWPWALVWLGYAAAQTGLVWLGVTANG